MAENKTDTLQYMPFSSFINPTFWHRLTQIKIDIDRLNDDSKSVWGFYSNVFTNETASLLEVDSTSFNNVYHNQKLFLPAYGTLLNKNTIEQFKETDKTQLLENFGLKIWESIKNGNALENPDILNVFIILSFADLKKYKYYYWFAFPAPTNLIVKLKSEPKKLAEVFDEKKLEYLTKCSIQQEKQKSFFIVQTDQASDALNILNLNSAINSESKDDNLSDYNLQNIYFAFADPCNTNNPGWPLRNYLALLLYNCPILYGKTINVISFRLVRQKTGLNCSDSLVFYINVPEYGSNFENIVFSQEKDKSYWSGWEKNERGKFGPRLTDMSASMDPSKLAETSVDLNLKLMKWRLLPNLDLAKIKKMKCLLLGSGTLGCSVARSLLGWGVDTITFVDNGKVSYSNPVRQSLFFHEDCLKGGKPKALAAAANIKKIYPGVKSSGYQINIPMPGHSIGESLLDETKKNVDELIRLVQEHDVIFLLMDSRESRWLPTVLAASFGKIAINAALGFDTYLVMRHGIRNFEDVTNYEPTNLCGLKVITGNHLGCYFCQDITAPGDSLKDRTLDQQCTVTRPGISAIAGSIAVELLISISQHKDGPLAKAYIKTEISASSDIEDESLLGIVPHSIRGFLSSYSCVLPATMRYNQCIACSDVVLEEYKKNGFDFLLNVFNSAKYLEDLTGLTEIHKQTDVAEIWEMSDSEFDED